MLIAGETNKIFTPKASGNYAVILTTNGCQSTSECYSFNFLGTSSFIKNKITLYPNPSSGKIYTNLNQSEIKQVDVYDSFGNLVANDLNLVNLSSGIYLIKITLENNNFIQKIIKK